MITLDIEDKPELYVATFLDPQYKDCYFEDETTVEKAKKIVLDEMVKIAEKNSATDVTVETENNPSTSNTFTFKDAMNSFKAKRIKLDDKSNNNIRAAASKGNKNFYT